MPTRSFDLLIFISFLFPLIFRPHPKYVIVEDSQEGSGNTEDEKIPGRDRFKEKRAPPSRDSGYVGDYSDELSSSAGARSLRGSILSRYIREIRIRIYLLSCMDSLYRFIPLRVAAV
jgi:hypothetical protein